MNSCQGCTLSSLSTPGDEDYVDVSLLLSWYYVCKAKDQWGDQQGAACWKGQPLDYVPCVSQTVKKSGGSTSGGSTSGGSTGSDTAQSSPAPEPSPEGATSAAAASSNSFKALSLIFAGVAVVLAA
ncbi:MAG: hypothetical protein Q9226_005048 [Calogaya cf. arnoldii]